MKRIKECKKKVEVELTEIYNNTMTMIDIYVFLIN